MGKAFNLLMAASPSTAPKAPSRASELPRTTRRTVNTKASAQSAVPAVSLLTAP